MAPRSLAIGLVVAWAVASLGACGGEPWCPDTWTLGERADGRAVCEPTAEHAEAVRRRVGTGFFGYVIGCRAVERGSATCEPEGLARGGVLSIEGVRPDGQVDSLVVQVSSDGTYEVEASPHVVYRIDGSPFFTAGARTQTFASLEEGEVRFFRLVRACGGASQEDGLQC